MLRRNSELLSRIRKCLSNSRQKRMSTRTSHSLHVGWTATLCRTSNANCSCRVNTYGTVLFFKCGEYKITSQFMGDPEGGWRGRQYALERIHAVSAKMSNLMFKTWIAVRKEWLETCRGITGGTMEDALLFAMDSEPIPCDEMPYTFNTKFIYAE